MPTVILYVVTVSLSLEHVETLIQKQPAVRDEPPRDPHMTHCDDVIVWALGLGHAGRRTL